MMYSGSLLAALVAALACSAPAAARPSMKAYKKHDKAPPAELQLENARVPQPVQRREFPLEGEDSAFKFNFAADVRPPLPLPHLRCLPEPRRWRLNEHPEDGGSNFKSATLTDAAPCRATQSTMRRCCNCK